MNYADGTEVRLNDVVDHALCRGEVVVTCDSHGTSVYQSGYEWTLDEEAGVWVRFDNDALVRLGEASEDEDLVFVARGNETSGNKPLAT